MILFFAERENHHWDPDAVSKVEPEFGGQGQEFWLVYDIQTYNQAKSALQTQIRTAKYDMLSDLVRRTLSTTIGFWCYIRPRIYKILHAGLSSVWMFFYFTTQKNFQNDFLLLPFVSDRVSLWAIIWYICQATKLECSKGNLTRKTSSI